MDLIIKYFWAYRENTKLIGTENQNEILKLTNSTNKILYS